MSGPRFDQWLSLFNYGVKCPSMSHLTRMLSEQTYGGQVGSQAGLWQCAFLILDRDRDARAETARAARVVGDALQRVRAVRHAGRVPF
jgi:hypothetical protein